MKSVKLLIVTSLTFLVTGLSAQNVKSTQCCDAFDIVPKEIPNDRVIRPYSLEVSFDKTIHIIFPDAVLYIDLGSADIIAGKVDAAENVLRVKAAFRDFKNETNFSVITQAGNFYAFNVKYASDPKRLNIEMKDFIHNGETVNPQDNTLEVYLTELGNTSPKMMNLIMKSIYIENKKKVKHIGSKHFGVQYILKSIYSHSNMLYFHTEIKNSSHVIYDIDFISFKIVDKKVAKRTAIQETIIKPVRVYNFVTQVKGKAVERTVLAFEKFTIPDDKQLEVELFEKNGGRHQSYVIENAELVRAKGIDKLNME